MFIALEHVIRGALLCPIFGGKQDMHYVIDCIVTRTCIYVSMTLNELIGNSVRRGTTYHATAWDVLRQSTYLGTACDYLEGMAARVPSTLKPSQGAKQTQAVASHLTFFRHWRCDSAVAATGWTPEFQRIQAQDTTINSAGYATIRRRETKYMHARQSLRGPRRKKLLARRRRRRTSAGKVYTTLIPTKKQDPTVPRRKTWSGWMLVIGTGCRTGLVCERQSETETEAERDSDVASGRKVTNEGVAAEFESYGRWYDATLSVKLPQYIQAIDSKKSDVVRAKQ
ncbi:hypothetical protein C8R45DRAFT_928945 [Mycena sanguinolenta]|nr:hypothetical protein C8R45DRAFT_928945 [Mycena sanguinolenta]